MSENNESKITGGKLSKAVTDPKRTQREDVSDLIGNTSPRVFRPGDPTDNRRPSTPMKPTGR